MTRLLLLATVLLLLITAGAWLRHMLKRHGAGPLVWRWLSGHPLDGYHRTDATWTRKSSKVLHPTGRAVRWHHLPRLYRAGIRTGSTFGFFLLLYGLVAFRTETLGGLAAFALAGLLAAGWWLWRKQRHLVHQWRYVRPVRTALIPVLDGAPPRLAIEPDRSRIVVALPGEFAGTDAQKQLITHIVTARLGIEAPDADWQLEGRKLQAVFTKSEPPPPKVRPRDIRAAIDAAAEHEVILGIGKKRQVIDVSLDSEAPHLGMCMSTGDGKSTAAMNIATQLLHHGGLVLFLDYKLMSHMWARGLPNVAYAGTPAEIHALLIWLANDDERDSELTRRKQVALASADIRGNVTADLGPRILVVAEELNATQKRLRAYWRKIGGKGPSPASEALDEVMFTGRQLRVHVLQIGQRLSAKASGSDGSADSRENLGAIIFSNPSASTWKMLCDGHAQPPASDHKGRYQVVSRKQVREMQGAWWDEEDARAFATAGTVALPRSDMPFVTRTLPVTGAAVALIQGQAWPDLRDVPPVPIAPPGAVTLTEAAAAGLFLSAAAARKRKQRDPAFPAAVGERGAALLYDLRDLYDYTSAKGRVQR